MQAIEPRNIKEQQDIHFYFYPPLQDSLLYMDCIAAVKTRYANP
jgi:hypothetical protein